MSIFNLQPNKTDYGWIVVLRAPARRRVRTGLARLGVQQPDDVQRERGVEFSEFGHDGEAVIVFVSIAPSAAGQADEFRAVELAEWAARTTSQCPPSLSWAYMCGIWYDPTGQVTFTGPGGTGYEQAIVNWATRQVIGPW